MSLRCQDDKLLGEKVHNYCSSSEDEREDESVSEDEKEQIKGEENTVAQQPTMKEHNTGPKGVIEDWKAFKNNEHLKRQQEEMKKKEMIKEMLLTCDNENDDLDDEDKQFLEEYSKRRMIEMQQKFSAKSAGVCFGKVIELNTENYVEQIEDEEKFVSIIVHIYDETVAACQALNGCMQVLADKYKAVKWCKVKAKTAKLSMKFQDQALPALLVYKNNELIGNFIKLSENLGDDFFATDVESFLLSYSLLPEDARCA